MHQVKDANKRCSLEEYIRSEESGTQRHEFDDGNLVEVQDEPIIHNRRCLKMVMILKSLFKPPFEVYMENVKVNIEGENKYVYPDLILSKGQPKKELPFKDYILYEPLLIAEILSDKTRKHDLIDKFILYQKVSSLEYFLAIELEKRVVIFYDKAASNSWTAKTFTDISEVISLPKFGAQLTMSDIYS